MLNAAVLRPVMLLRNGIPSWISSWEIYNFFCSGYGLDQLRERLLLKESYNIQKVTIYWILENFLEKIIFKNPCALSFKWLLRYEILLLWDCLSSSLQVWGFGQDLVNSWNFQQRYVWLRLFDDLINISNQCAVSIPLTRGQELCFKFVKGEGCVEELFLEGSMMGKRWSIFWRWCSGFF